MQIEIKNGDNQVCGTTEISDRIWTAQFNSALLHQVLVAQQANKRLGTHKTLRKSEVSYSNRKIRMQKGSGNSRQGSRKAPHARSGAVAHGPTPQDFRQRLPKKMRRQALCIVLSEKLRQGNVSVLESIDITQPSTKSIVSILEAFEVRGSTLILTESVFKVVCKSAANLSDVRVIEVVKLSALEAAKHNNLFITVTALKKLDNLFENEVAVEAQEDTEMAVN